MRKMIIICITIVMIVSCTKSNLKYSTMECYEDYNSFVDELESAKDSSSIKRVRYILDNGFWIDSDSVVHERSSLIEVIEASKNIE